MGWSAREEWIWFIKNAASSQDLWMKCGNPAILLSKPEPPGHPGLLEMGSLRIQQAALSVNADRAPIGVGNWDGVRLFAPFAIIQAASRPPPYSILDLTNDLKHINLHRGNQFASIDNGTIELKLFEAEDSSRSHQFRKSIPAEVIGTPRYL